MKDWKTTVAGALTIVATVATAAVAFLQGHAIDGAMIATLTAGVTAGVGLIHASDTKK